MSYLDAMMLKNNIIFADTQKLIIVAGRTCDNLNILLRKLTEFGIPYSHYDDLDDFCTVEHMYSVSAGGHYMMVLDELCWQLFVTSQKQDDKEFRNVRLISTSMLFWFLTDSSNRLDWDGKTLYSKELGSLTVAVVGCGCEAFEVALKIIPSCGGRFVNLEDDPHIFLILPGFKPTRSFFEAFEKYRGYEPVIAGMDWLETIKHPSNPFYSNSDPSKRKKTSVSSQTSSDDNIPAVNIVPARLLESFALYWACSLDKDIIGSNTSARLVHTPVDNSVVVHHPDFAISRLHIFSIKSSKCLCVHPDWITQCITEDKLVSIIPHLLEPPKFDPFYTQTTLECYHFYLLCETARDEIIKKVTKLGGVIEDDVSFADVVVSDSVTAFTGERACTQFCVLEYFESAVGHTTCKYYHTPVVSTMDSHRKLLEGYTVVFFLENKFERQFCSHVAEWFGARVLPVQLAYEYRITDLKKTFIIWDGTSPAGMLFNKMWLSVTVIPPDAFINVIKTRPPTLFSETKTHSGFPFGLDILKRPLRPSGCYFSHPEVSYESRRLIVQSVRDMCIKMYFKPEDPFIVLYHLHWLPAPVITSSCGVFAQLDMYSSILLFGGAFPRNDQNFNFTRIAGNLFSALDENHFMGVIMGTSKNRVSTDFYGVVRAEDGNIVCRIITKLFVQSFRIFSTILELQKTSREICQVIQFVECICDRACERCSLLTSEFKGKVSFSVRKFLPYQLKSYGLYIEHSQENQYSLKLFHPNFKLDWTTYSVQWSTITKTVKDMLTLRRSNIIPDTSLPITLQVYCSSSCAEKCNSKNAVQLQLSQVAKCSKQISFARESQQSCAYDKCQTKDKIPSYFYVQ